MLHKTTKKVGASSFSQVKFFNNFLQCTSLTKFYQLRIAEL
jgi:hypothetical protein